MDDDKTQPHQGSLTQEMIENALNTLKSQKQTPLDKLKPFTSDHPLILKLFPPDKKGQSS